MYCLCKRLKLETSCDKQRTGLVSLDCDENCKDIARKHTEAKLKEEELARQKEDDRNLREVEQFERKFKRKPKERKSNVEKNKREINWRLIWLCTGIFGALLIAILLAFSEDH